MCPTVANGCHRALAFSPEAHIIKLFLTCDRKTDVATVYNLLWNNIKLHFARSIICIK